MLYKCSVVAVECESFFFIKKKTKTTTKTFHLGAMPEFVQQVSLISPLPEPELRRQFNSYVTPFRR